MKPEIIEIEATPILYCSRKGSDTDTPMQAWREVMNYLAKHALDPSTMRFFGVAYTPHGQPLTYHACIGKKDQLPADSKLTEGELATGTYAQFTHIGPMNQLEEIFETIYTEWLPTAPFEEGPHPCICEYKNLIGGGQSDENAVTKIYVSLNKCLSR